MKYIFIILIFFFNSNSFGKEDDHADHADEKHEHHNLDHHEHEHKNKQKSIKAHQHGLSKLSIVQEEKSLLFEFEMPGHDVVGFEHKAKKKEDVQKVKYALSVLSKTQNMIILPKQAECKEKSIFTDVLNEGSHSEFISKYKFECKKIKNLNRIEIAFLKNFKNSQKLKVSLVAEKKDMSQTLELSNNFLLVEGFF